MAKEHLQIKEFSDCTSDNAEKANEFLKEIGTRMVSVIPIYNTINGGIQYVITYWC